MFDKTADLYDTIYSFKDYAAESARLEEIVRSLNPGARSLLDVACGTGKHLEALRASFPDAAGIDLDPGLLAVARTRNPGVLLVEGDMRTFDLGRTFDVVACLFSAIGYMQTVEDLTLAIRTMAAHAAPGGVVVVEPWFEPDAWRTGDIAARFVDEPDLKIARMNVSGRERDCSIVEFRYLIGTPQGIEHRTERHVLGLFAREQYVAAFEAASIEVTIDPEDLALGGRGLYYGVKAHSSDVTA